MAAAVLGGLGKRAARVQHDGTAVDIDLAGPFPVPPDGCAGQQRMRSHLVRVVVEKAPWVGAEGR